MKRIALGYEGKSMHVTPEQALTKVVEQFPFDGYMLSNRERKRMYLDIAGTVLSYLKPGDTILDFGCGPCDKTAVLQFLGFRCSGYDDLQDNWHKLPENREKILGFARECGVDFALGGDDGLPFEKESFDMVMLHHVLEHLHHSPRDLMNDLLELCKPEGLLFVTVPNAVNIRKRIHVLFGRTNLPRFEIYYWYPGAWRGHIREYTRDDLAELTEYLDLEVLELRGCDHLLQALPKGVEPLYLLITGILDGLKDSWLLVARKRPGWHPRKTPPSPES